MEKIKKVKKVYDTKSIDELASNKYSMNINDIHSENLTFGQRVSDKLAIFAGSWKFIISFGLILLIWIIINSIYLLVPHFDPFPFILLNLILSCLAAIQAPIIMMSQNRQEAKDRLRAEHDYEVNLKTEILIEEVINMLNDLNENQKIIMEHIENDHGDQKYKNESEHLL